MNERDIEDLCKKLKPILKHKADSLWLAYITEANILVKNEMAAMINALAVKHLTETVHNTKILLPPPSKAEAKGEFPLGLIYYGTEPKYPLYLTRENFIKQIGIFSITGGGKTNVGHILLLGLLKKKIPFMVLDWKRSWRNVLSLDSPHVKDVEVYTVGRQTDSSFNWNPLRGPPGVHPRTWIAVIAEALEKSHISGQGVADILIDVLDKKFEEFGVYDGTYEKYPNFFDARDALGRIQYKGRKMLWADSCSRILRTFIFGPGAGAFNARHPIKIEDLLEKRVIFELDQELPKPLRVFFSDIILRWIHLYRLSQGETDDLRHVLILEESHNLTPKGKIEVQSTNSLENVFREIRGFGQGLVSITQHPSMLPLYILGNCNTQIYLGLQHEDDVTAAKKSLFLERGDEVFLDRLRVGEGIVKIKGRVDPCYVKFPLVPVMKGAVTDDMLRGVDK